MIQSITELMEKDLRGKKVLLRIDFNVPVEHGKVSEMYKIRSAKETLDYLKSHGAVIALLSHITSIESFESIYNQIKEILGHHFIFLPDCIGSRVYDSIKNARSGDIFLLENVRKHSGEEKNDLEFSQELAKPFDMYINDAFSESHRNYASITSITKFLPSYAGPGLIKELENLEKVMQLPKEKKTLIIGGAKAEIKFPVVENFLDKSSHILVGGVVANIFLKASGVDIGESVTDDNFLLKAKHLLLNKQIVMPEDFTKENDMILDIGLKTAEKFSEIIKNSTLVIWSGPLGKTEVPELSLGSKKIAEAIASSSAFSVIGGGDTIAFIEKINLINKFNYVSIGGGAMLEFLAGNTLPGIKVLGYYGS